MSIKKHVTGEKATSDMPIIEVPASSTTSVCKTDRFEPKKELKMKSAGIQMTRVSKNRIGSLIKDEAACFKLCWLPIMRPYMPKEMTLKTARLRSLALD